MKQQESKQSLKRKEQQHRQRSSVSSVNVKKESIQVIKGNLIGMMHLKEQDVRLKATVETSIPVAIAVMMTMDQMKK